MRGPHREPGGDGGAFGDRAPVRHMAEFARRWNAQDVEGALEFYADDWRMVDHRTLGWEPASGREAARALLHSGFAGSPNLRFEIDEVLACDDRVIAMRVAHRGTMIESQGAGELEYPLGMVLEFEGAAVKSNDIYEPEDREKMLARFAELSGAARRLPAARPVERVVRLGDRTPERLVAQHVECFNAHDLDGLSALVTEDFVTLDHRKVGIGSTRGREHYERALRTIFDPLSDMRLTIDEVIACDDGAIAVRTRYSGTGAQWSAGDYEVLNAELFAVRDDRLARLEHYNPDDRQAIVARYAELGGGVGPLGDRPPERHVRHYAQRFAARDLDGLAELFADDLVFVDHREGGWEPMRGRDGALHVFTSGQELMTDMRLEVDEVLAVDDRVIAMLVSIRGAARDGGGQIVIPLGRVSLVDAGRAVIQDEYEPEAREAILARFAELSDGAARSTGGPGLGDTPIERVLAESNRAFNAHEFERHFAQHRADFVLVDHRSLGWGEVRGREALGDLVSSALAVSDDVRLHFHDVLASDGVRVIAVRGAWRSSGSRTAGPWEIPVGFVTVVEDGLIASHDLYPHDAVDRMLRRYHELSALGADPPR